MGQRAGPGIEPTAPADSDDEILGEPLLRDEVDDLVAAWRAQRPDLDVEPMQVLSRISRLARHLDIARRGAFAEHELESWEFDVLSALRRQGPPFQLTPGALLRATLVTSGTMTNRIDRLAAEGLVRREPDPRDKRGVLVTLTDRGQERVDAALAGLLRARAGAAGGPGRRRARAPGRPDADPARPLRRGRVRIRRRSPAATVSQRSSRSDFSAWAAFSSAPSAVSFS